MNIAENMDAAEQGTLKSLNGLEEMLPEIEPVKELLDRYGTILLDGINDEESTAETLSAGGVDQECTALEGSISAKEAVSLIQEILNTVKEDEELKNLIESWTKDMDDEKYSYENFLKSIENIENEIEEEGEAGDGSLLSKIWMDEEGNVAGRQISVVDADGSTEPLFVWKSPKADSQCGLMLELYDDESIISLEGCGELTGDLLNGSYTLSMDGTEFAIDVKDYNTAAMKAGNLNGSYTLSIVPAQTGDEEYNPMEGFELVADFAGDNETGSITLSLNSSGSNLLSIGLAARPGKQVEYVDVSAMDKIYDVDSDADGEAFTNDMSLDTIMDNLMAAGMPEGFIEELMSSGEDTDLYSDNSYLDEEDMQN